MSLHRAFIRLHRRKDILRVYANGERLRGHSFDLIVVRGEGGKLRIAVIVPLMGMSAVERNRVKRRTKEALRMSEYLSSISGDVIVRAKKEAYERDYEEIQKELENAFSSLSKS